MGESSPRVEFALGSEVSPGHFFKSSFARSFVSASCRDSKSLDYELYEEGLEESRPPGLNNNFYSLVDFEAEQQQGRPAGKPWPQVRPNGGAARAGRGCAEV